MTIEQKEFLRGLVLQMMECGLFCGKYDARHGSDEFMHGIATVMEYLAIQVSVGFYEEVSDIFTKNMVVSQKAVEG